MDNFYQAAKLQNCSPAKALMGFVAKHIVALYKYVSEPVNTTDYTEWNEKIGDIINYMILLDAIVIEELEEFRERKEQHNDRIKP